MGVKGGIVTRGEECLDGDGGQHLSPLLQALSPGLRTEPCWEGRKGVQGGSGLVVTRRQTGASRLKKMKFIRPFSQDQSALELRNEGCLRKTGLQSPARREGGEPERTVEGGLKVADSRRSALSLGPQYHLVSAGCWSRGPRCPGPNFPLAFAAVYL